MYFMCKVNTTWITHNIEKMKYRLNPLRQMVEMIVSNSKLQNSTNSDYLPRGLFIAIWGNIVSMVDMSKTIIGRLAK